MNASEVLPAQFNAATHFVDRNVAEGRGASNALLYEDRTLGYAGVQELANRTVTRSSNSASGWRTAS